MLNITMERIEAIVSGKVQMVMYRDFASRHAKRLTGEVRNLEDGTVAVIAEGMREDLEAYIGKLNKGPLFAHVSGVSVSWKEATGQFDRFSIRYA